MLVITRGYTIYTTLVCLLTRSGSLQYDPFPFFESYPKFDTLPFSWHRFCGFCCLSCHVFAILCPTISTPICSLLLANMPQSQKVMHSKLPLATDVCPKKPTNTRSHERMPLALNRLWCMWPWPNWDKMHSGCCCWEAATARV